VETYSSEAASFFGHVSFPEAGAFEPFPFRLENLRTIADRPDIYYYY
jgi:hypothetical protein